MVNNSNNKLMTDNVLSRITSSIYIIDVGVYGNNMVRTVFDINLSFRTKRGQLKIVKLMRTKLTIQDEEYGE
jgi:hypothetical protein